MCITSGTLPLNTSSGSKHDAVCEDVPLGLVLMLQIERPFKGSDKAFAEVPYAGFEVGAEFLRFFELPCLYRLLIRAVKFRFQGFDFRKL